MTLRWWPSSLRARLSLWFTLVLGVPLVAFAVVSYVVFDRTLLERTDQFVGDALGAFAQELANERRLAATTQVAAVMTVHEVRFRQLQVVIADTAFMVVAASPAERMGDDPPVERPEGVVGGRGGSSTLGVRHLAPDTALRALRLAGGIGAEPLFLTLDWPGGAYRVHGRRLQLAGEPLLLAGIAPLHDIEEVLARIRRAFFVAIPLLLAAAAAGGYFMARRALSPVGAMGARAAAITDTNLHERLPVVSPRDELGGLATVINSLLDRLERAFAQQRRFMADASHELRTPTAILATEAQVTLSRATRGEKEYRESMQVMQGAASRLTRIVDDLFLLARADAGHLVARHADVYLDEVVHSATRAVRPLAERRGVQVELLPVMDAPFHGDADLLGRLILNLLDNAIKFSVGGRGQVTVELALHATARVAGAGTEAPTNLGAPSVTPRYEVRVVDDGPGIAPEVQERVFERFFRGDPARVRVEASATSGAGLGLAIARRIAEAHGGTLELVASRPGHTEFCLTLPIRAPVPARAAGATAASGTIAPPPTPPAIVHR